MVIPMLQMGKLRHREAESLAKDTQPVDDKTEIFRENFSGPEVQGWKLFSELPIYMS